MTSGSGQFFLSAESRQPKKRDASKLRKNRKLPAVIYGHGVTARPVAVDQSAFSGIFKKAGATTLIDIAVDQDKPVKVLIADVQYDTRTGSSAHVDFHQVSMTEKVSAEIPLSFTGESPAVKEQGGVLVKNLDRVRVEALPGDLVSEIAVDLAPLKSFEDKILVNNLVVPTGVTVLEAPEEVVALVEPPRSEEEIAALSEAVEEKVEDVGVVEKPKKEGEEEAAEGEGAAEAKPKAEKT